MDVETRSQQRPPDTGALRPMGLYVHIPFCRTRCAFCGFYLEVYRPDRAARFLTALRKELALYGKQPELSGRSLCSIYFGGGTPDRKSVV